MATEQTDGPTAGQVLDGALLTLRRIDLLMRANQRGQDAFVLTSDSPETVAAARAAAQEAVAVIRRARLTPVGCARTEGASQHGVADLGLSGRPLSDDADRHPGGDQEGPRVSVGQLYVDEATRLERRVDAIHDIVEGLARVERDLVGAVDQVQGHGGDLPAPDGAASSSVVGAPEGTSAAGSEGPAAPFAGSHPVQLTLATEPHPGDDTADFGRVMLEAARFGWAQQHEFNDPPGEPMPDGRRWLRLRCRSSRDALDAVGALSGLVCVTLASVTDVSDPANVSFRDAAAGVER